MDALEALEGPNIQSAVPWTKGTNQNTVTWRGFRREEKEKKRNGERNKNWPNWNGIRVWKPDAQIGQSIRREMRWLWYSKWAYVHVWLYSKTYI